MLDSFLIFARGGIILFSWSAVALKGAPVQTLVQDVLLEERSGVQEWAYSAGATKYTLRFTFHNEAGLVFVAVCFSLYSIGKENFVSCFASYSTFFIQRYWKS